jgi:hypothetical protein
MAVVIDEFEATGEPANDAKDAPAKPKAPPHHELRRWSRVVAVRAARVSARG